MSKDYPNFKSPAPIMTPWLVDAVTGLFSTFPFPIAGVERDAIVFSKGPPWRGHQCPSGSLPLLYRIRDRLADLAKQGVDLGTIVLDIDDAGDLVVLSRSNLKAKARCRRIPDEDVDRVRAPNGSPRRPSTLQT